ncbi:glycosyltransferase family 9 protein [Actinacidiphila glaucinigra]|uniref:glycosyltransferase family 9 protein n=1 Tax=Actinacidiphila glaucinigra TaxID=235986 RepID=UPI0036A50234
MTDATRPRVLVLRALGLGDLLTAVPALRGLRRALPGHELVFAAPARLAGACAATGTVDRLLPTTAPGREVPASLPWRGPPPRLAVDLHGNGPPSHLLLLNLRPERLLAYAHPATPAVAGPAWHEDEHERTRWCRLLTWYGLPADPLDLALPRPRTPSPAPGAVVVHPGADAPARCWPAERFAAVAGRLRRTGHRVVITAGTGEAELARQVAHRAGLSAGDVLGGTADVPFARLAALIVHARCVIVGDTGLAHLASAFGTPSVVLFGPVSPRLWGPPDVPCHRVLWHGDHHGAARPGDAHGPRPDRRLLDITVDEVLHAAREAMRAPRKERVPGSATPASAS